ncbi:hypothetical protein RFI_10877 [Reticulomyxa filosa]|uniref:GSKIP domain-containing protein n=1 Tax=Reticulomyxa filosa TaxID=46433 RepID=X6NLK3_RETFI|nr:hypothetical protein RFI_10877 [Reticulomyxa filosa]|eukprot:ETO26262.1 hypothetical protein RFI_10877 [Reticulomyxa filosa]
MSKLPEAEEESSSDEELYPKDVLDEGDIQIPTNEMFDDLLRQEVKDIEFACKKIDFKFGDKSSQFDAIVDLTLSDEKNTVIRVGTVMAKGYTVFHKHPGSITKLFSLHLSDFFSSFISQQRIESDGKNDKAKSETQKWYESLHTLLLKESEYYGKVCQDRIQKQLAQ